MLILGSLLWRTTGVGAPPAPPAPTPDTAVRPSGGFPAGDDRARSREEISRARERFGLRDEVAQALAEVARRQAEADAAALGQQAEADGQKRFDELYRELQLRSIEFEARYLEALASLREGYAEQARRNLLQRKQEEELMLLMMLAAAAAAG